MRCPGGQRLRSSLLKLTTRRRRWKPPVSKRRRTTRRPTERRHRHVLVRRADEGPAYLEECQAAASAGDIGAQIHLAFIYAEGKVVPQSYAEAARWLRRAADMGEPP